MDETKLRLVKELDAVAPVLLGLARDIHAHPELGLAEHHASAVLAETLASGGYRVEQGVAGMPTAFKAVARSGLKGPVVALLAEYDALPGLGHACGHNLVGTAAVGAGLALQRVGGWPGQVWVLGTPAEETVGGKVELIRAGIFRSVDAAMMVHGGDTWLVQIKTMALEPLEFTFLGRAAHAAAAPEEGINALDAAILLYNGIGALRQHLRPDVRMHGIITEGGVAPNVVPDRAQTRWYLRANDRPYLNQVVEKVKDVARGAAAMTGARLEMRQFENPNDNFRSNTTMASLFTANVHALGHGPVRIDDGGPQGSTDIGNVSQRVPCIHPIFPVGDEPLVCHTPEFAAAAVSERGLQTMLVAAKAMAMTALDLLTRPEVLDQVQAEFRPRPR